MGGFSAQVQQGQTSGGGKMGPMGQAISQTSQQTQDPMLPVQGANGVVTNSATSGQPMMGQANDYSNTVGQWDNANQQTQQPLQFKGKGGGAQSGGGLGKGA